MEHHEPVEERPGTDRRTFLLLGAAAVAAPILAASLPARRAEALGLTGSTSTAASTSTAYVGSPLTVLMDGGADDAKILMEGLPVGNGRLGALVGGRPDVEHLALNEDSLWSGSLNPTGDYGKMGTYKALGAVFLDLGHDPSKVSGYRRELDVATGLVTVTYDYEGATYTRETFASHPDQVVVMTVTSTAKKALSGTLSVVDGGGRTPSSVTARPGHLSVTGAISGDGVGYGWTARLDAPGAATLTADPAGSTSFTKVTKLTVVVGARTSYVPDASTSFRSTADPLEQATSDVTGAMAYSAARLRKRHLDDFTELFDRQTISLGTSSEAQLANPTFERVQDNQTTTDPALYALYYQFARYLTISGSRAGGLPMNLQGLWNVSDAPPWSSDYHNDINVQMCYWLADPANLPESVTPLVDYLVAQIPSWRTATQAVAHKPGSTTPVRGWTVRVSSNVSGGLGWDWMPMGGAWLAWHMWDHYTYTLDTGYLRDTAYPVLKELVQYLQDVLVDDGNGKLVVPDSWSPEHTQGKPWRTTDIGYKPVGMAPYEDGVSMDQELAWDLLSNFVDASTVLGTDADLRATAKDLRDRLHVPAVGSWGQLQEWYTDKDVKTDNHRHVSHLVGVFPGRQITQETTPDLFAAAKVSLAARGIGPTGWSAAWNANLWATLRDPANAWKALANLTQPVTPDHDVIDMNYHGGVYPNLFDAHPPFQIDGNLGGGRAFVQMLLQSSMEQVDVLPALPDAWPAGSFTGIRARGGFEVDLTWSGGALESVTVHNLAGGSTQLRYRDRTVLVAIDEGRYATYDGALDVVATGNSKR